MNPTRVRLAVLMLASAVYTCAAFAAGDVVVLKGGRSKPEGTITEDSIKGVTLRVGRGGAKASYGRDQVERVVYEKTPHEYNFGFNSMRGGNYEVAISHLEGALEKDHAPLLKQYILFYMGRCLIQTKEFDAAVSKLEELKKMGDATRFKVEARQLLIDLYLQLNDLRKVKKLLGELGTGTSRSEKVQIMTIKAKVEEKQNRFSAALRMYRSAIDMAGPDPDLSTQAELGSLRCLVGLKKYDDAVRAIDRIVRAGRGDDVNAEAYLLKGDALKARAKSPDDWEAALLAYLRVPALYAGDEKTEARALLEAARCYRQIPGRNSKKRADSLMGLLQRKYPNSAAAKAGG